MGKGVTKNALISLLHLSHEMTSMNKEKVRYNNCTITGCAYYFNIYYLFVFVFIFPGPHFPMVFGEWGSFTRCSYISAWTCLAHPTVGGQRSGSRDAPLVIIIETEHNLNIHSSTEYASSLLYVTTHLSVLSSSLFSLWLIFQNLLSEKRLQLLGFCNKTKPICVVPEFSNKKQSTWQPVSSDSSLCL